MTQHHQCDLGAAGELAELAAAVRRRQTGQAGDRDGQLLAPAPPVFGRGDPNLANYLWDGVMVTAVDFEHAGWRDRAVELADLVEHVQARSTPPEGWVWLVERIGLDREELARFRAARRLFCLFWLTVIEPGAGRRPATLAPAGQLAWASAVLDGAVDL